MLVVQDGRRRVADGDRGRVADDPRVRVVREVGRRHVDRSRLLQEGGGEEGVAGLVGVEAVGHGAADDAGDLAAAAADQAHLRDLEAGLDAERHLVDARLEPRLLLGRVGAEILGEDPVLGGGHERPLRLLVHERDDGRLPGGERPDVVRARRQPAAAMPAASRRSPAPVPAASRTLRTRPERGRPG